MEVVHCLYEILKIQYKVQKKLHQTDRQTDVYTHTPMLATGKYLSEIVTNWRLTNIICTIKKSLRSVGGAALQCCVIQIDNRIALQGKSGLNVKAHRVPEGTVY